MQKTTRTWVASLAITAVTLTGAWAAAQTRDPNQDDKNRTDQNRPTQNKMDQKTGQDMNRDRMDQWQFPKRWQKASDLVGKSVVNPQGEDLGKIEDLAIDTRSGRVIYGVLSFGGVLGIGNKWFAIPFRSLNLQPDYKKFTLAVDKDRLKNATGFDKDHWPNMADQRWGAETYKYYNEEPYWQLSSDVENDRDRHDHDKAAPMTGEGGTGDQTKDRTTGGQRTTITIEERGERYHRYWAEPVSAWQKQSDLQRKHVKTIGGTEDLGDVDDLVIDPDSGRVLYVVTDYNGKKYAIPWSMCDMPPSYDYIETTLTGEQLKKASAAEFESNSWPNFGDQTVARHIHEELGAPIYWDKKR